MVIEIARRVGDTHAFTPALRAARLAATARAVFNGSETVGRLGPTRLAVIAERDDRLGRRVALVRRMLGPLELTGRPARVWIEGLPPAAAGAASVLDDLACA